MELCEERDLHDYIFEDSEPVIPESKVRQVLFEILSAMHFLHSNQILHRDVKPANIFLTADGHCKVGDYGLAKHYKLSAGMRATTTQNACTQQYQSLERTRGIPFAAEDPNLYKSDIWYVGLIGLKMLTKV